MLGSITPLGERGRRSSWTVTVLAFAVASVAGGAAVGGGLGLIGAAAALPWAARPWVLAGVTGVGLILDLAPGGLTLPTVRRQVNEAWIHRFRPWVYGLGFGFQLGAGMVTVVVSSAVYAAFAAAFLTGTVAGGVSVGATFGLVRATTILPAGRIRHPRHLGRIDVRIRELDGPSKRMTLACELALVAACVAVAAV